MSSIDILEKFGYLNVLFKHCNGNTLCYSGLLDDTEITIYAFVSEMNNLAFSAKETVKGIVEMVGGENHISNVDFYIGNKIVNWYAKFKNQNRYQFLKNLLP